MAETSAIPGTIAVKGIFITNYNRTERFDIFPIVDEFSFIEDLAQPIMRGSLMVTDALSLITQVPIVGGELVEVEFTVNSYDPTQYQHKPFKHDFTIVAIKDITERYNRVSTYVIQLASPEILSARMKKMVASYQDMPISQMVKEVALNGLGVREDKLEIDNTTTPRDWTAINNPPLELINFLCAEAMDTDNGPSTFIFYEDRERFHFTSFEQLKSGIRYLPVPEIFDTSQPDPSTQKGPGQGGGEPGSTPKKPGYEAITNAVDEEYFFTEQSIPGDEGDGGSATSNSAGSATTTGVAPEATAVEFLGGVKPRKFRRIYSFGMPDYIDIDKAAMTGTWDNTVFEIDISSQTFKTLPFNYYKSFDDFIHLKEKEAHRLIPEEMAFSGGNGESHQRIVLTDKYTAEKDKDLKPRQRSEFLNKRISSLGQMHYLVAHLTIPGDCDRKCGDIIKMNIPKFGATDDVKNKKNDYLSGRWLVLSVKHKYNKNAGYWCHMAIGKDCFETEIKDTEGKITKGDGTPKEAAPSEAPPVGSREV